MNAHRTIGTEDLIAYTRRHRHRRTLPFHDLTCTDLTQQQRALLSRDWERRMRQEHLAVGAFAMLSTELARVGSAPIVLSLATRASSDEAAHAEVCRRLAEAFRGAPVPARSSGLPNIPQHVAADDSTRVLLHLVEMCCIGETLTTCFFSEAIARAISAPMREILSFLLEDEIDHGRLGWAHLAGATRSERACVAAELPNLLERTVGWLSAKNRSHTKEDEQLETYGYLLSSTVTELYQRTLRDVVLTGFDEIGVDIGPAWRRATARGWLK